MVNTEPPAHWTQDNFDALGWHDCRIHGISFRMPREGYDCDLVLDLDYIVEWIKAPDGQFRFSVAPAELAFHDVAHLSMNVTLSYREEPVINNIEQEDISTDAQRAYGRPNYRWTISLHSLSGEPGTITFQSTGFDQHLRKPPVVQDRLDLDDAQR